MKRDLISILDVKDEIDILLDRAIELKAKQKDGSIYRVCLIKAGMSENGYFYPSDVLKKSASLF